MSDHVTEHCADGRTRVFDREGNVVETKPLTLREAISHAREAAECGGERRSDHEQLVKWLKELVRLRREAHQLRSDLRDAKKEISRILTVSGASHNGNVHLELQITRNGKGWRNVAEISEIAFEHPAPSYHDPFTWQVEILREAIQKLAYETAVGFFDRMFTWSDYYRGRGRR